MIDAKKRQRFAAFFPGEEWGELIQIFIDAQVSNDGALDLPGAPISQDVGALEIALGQIRWQRNRARECGDCDAVRKLQRWLKVLNEHRSESLALAASCRSNAALQGDRGFAA